MFELFTDVPSSTEPFVEEPGDSEAGVHLILEHIGQLFTDTFES